MAYSSAEPVSTEAGDLGESQESFVARLEPANINPKSFLATDYLNHFNEAIMLLELTPDMPDMLSEAKAWQPKDYKAHFMDSEFAAKELACTAYDHAPDQFRIPFDLTKRALDRKIAEAIEGAAQVIAEGQTERLGHVVETGCEAIRELICVAGGIINGCDVRSNQLSGQNAVESAAGEDQEVVMAQQAIDALFDEPAADEASTDPHAAVAPANDSAPAADAEEGDGGPVMSQADVDALFD